MMTELIFLAILNTVLLFVLTGISLLIYEAVCIILFDVMKKVEIFIKERKEEEI